MLVVNTHVGLLYACMLYGISLRTCHAHPVPTRQTFPQQYSHSKNTCTSIPTHTSSQDRTPYVEVLEEEMQTLASQRGHAYNTLRTTHHTEELELCDEAARATLGMLSTAAGDVHAAHAAAEVAFEQAESALVGRALPVVLDEFGRDENMGARQATKQRCVWMRARVMCR